MNRRQFLESSTAAVAGLATTGWPQQVSAQMPERPVGIQVGAVSFLDEGTDKVLETLRVQDPARHRIGECGAEIPIRHVRQVYFREQLHPLTGHVMRTSCPTRCIAKFAWSLFRKGDELCNIAGGKRKGDYQH